MGVYVRDILTDVKNLAHDLSYNDTELLRFVNLAIKDIDHYGKWDWQIVLDESVTSAGGTGIITTTYPVKEIIDYTISGDYQIKSDKGNLILYPIPTDDITFTLSYVRKHPEITSVDDELYLDQKWLITIGTVAYAMINNDDPASAVYLNKFNDLLAKLYSERISKTDYTGETYYNMFDGLGI